MSTDSQTAGHAPRVSVVLPIFNRKKFLPAAFGAIRDQQIDSLEVVVVDDGSGDESRSVVDQLIASFPHRVRYISQENQGPYGARNTGVAAASGKYIAFYDSDDVWLAHHLPACLSALDQNADVDWVYAACELVDLESQRVLEVSSFYAPGGARPFMSLQHDDRRGVRVITDAGAIRCQIDYGLYCGLQNSVLRRRVFDRLTFEAATRNEAEDQLFAIRALSAGFRLAYIDRVHVRYQVHAENSSGPTQDMTLAKRRRVYEPLINGYERLATEVPLTEVEQRALRRRIGHELFWHLGYTGYWAAGERREALRLYMRALRVWPWDPAQWKTYTLALIRSGLGLRRTHPAPSSGT
jgi:glycosyltransferase involved in cell wall biosynthesis